MNIIDSIKKYISEFENNQIVAYSPVDGSTKRVCSWENSVTIEVLNGFFEKYMWSVPKEYSDFLLAHNGATFFRHPYFGGGIRLFGMEEVETFLHQVNHIPSRYMPIGLTSFVSGYILLDTVSFQEGNNKYIYFLDAMEPIENAKPLQASFTEWLERLFLCQGNEYWLWN